MHDCSHVVTSAASVASRLVEEDALVLVLEPRLRLDLVVNADPSLPRAPLRDPHAARPLHDDVKVHAVDASRRVVLEAKVDVLHDTEAKVARRREVLLAQLVLLDLEATLQNLLRLLAAHRHMARDLLVTPDAEGTHGVARLREEGLLAGELLKHLGGAGQAIAGLTDRDVQDELLDLEIAHRIAQLLLGRHGS